MAKAHNQHNQCVWQVMPGSCVHFPGSLVAAGAGGNWVAGRGADTAALASQHPNQAQLSHAATAAEEMVAKKATAARPAGDEV